MEAIPAVNCLLYAGPHTIPWLLMWGQSMPACPTHHSGGKEGTRVHSCSQPWPCSAPKLCLHLGVLSMGIWRPVRRHQPLKGHSQCTTCWNPTSCFPKNTQLFSAAYKGSQLELSTTYELCSVYLSTNMQKENQFVQERCFWILLTNNAASKEHTILLSTWIIPWWCLLWIMVFKVLPGALCFTLEESSYPQQRHSTSVWLMDGHVLVRVKTFKRRKNIFSRNLK